MLLSAAAAPTRNEPSLAANNKLLTFGASTTESTMPKWMSGLAAATSVMGSVNMKPTPTMTCAPSPASSSRLALRSSSTAASSSLISTPSSLAARSPPVAAESLNVPSPRPPVSKATPAMMPLAGASEPAGASVVVPLSSPPQAAAKRLSAAIDAASNRAFLRIFFPPLNRLAGMPNER